MKRGSFLGPEKWLRGRKHRFSVFPRSFSGPLLAGLLVSLLALDVLAGPPSKYRNRPGVIMPIDRVEAEERLEAVRGYIPESDLLLFFELVERRSGQGEGRRLGILATGRIGNEAAHRFALIESRIGAADGVRSYRLDEEWRLRSGSSPLIERGLPGRSFEAVDRKQWMDPMVDGFSHTPFDLLMPFLYWEKFEYEGPDRVKGRSAHLIRFFPGEVDSEMLEKHQIRSVRIALDRKFNAPLLVEYLDEDESVVRSLRTVSFKEVDEVWTVGTVEARDFDRGLRSQLILVGGGAVPSVLPALIDSPRGTIDIPFDALGLEWF